MAKNSLILYASMTGNTEKVAMRFKETLEAKGWKADIFRVTAKNFNECPYKLDDYDLLLVGSPILAGIPAKQIFEDHFGILMPMRMWRQMPEKGFAPISEGYGPKKGIAFVTYTGNRRGPAEALPALGCLQIRLEDMRVACVGKFACPGKIKSHYAVDRVAEAKKWTVERASDAIFGYRDDPAAPEFADWSEKDLKLLAEAAADERDIPGWDRSLMWHWDQQDRPSERDLQKAQIFLEEILEDYYEGGVEAAPLSQYICIA